MSLDVVFSVVVMVPVVFYILYLCVCEAYKTYKMEKLYGKALQEKFPDASGYQIVKESGAGVWNRVYINDDIYIVVFAKQKPYPVVFCRKVDEEEVRAIVADREG